MEAKINKLIDKYEIEIKQYEQDRRYAITYWSDNQYKLDNLISTNKNFIQDLQDLLPEAVKSNPVEIAKEMTKDISWYDNPNEVEIKDWDNYKICKCKYRWIIYWDKFCSQCWKKIKRVE